MLRKKNETNNESDKAYSDAIKRCTESIQSDSSNYKAYAVRSNWHFSAGHYNEAIADCIAALRIISELHLTEKCSQLVADIYCRRGKCYFANKDFKSGISDFTATISIDSNNMHAFAGRGSCYMSIYNNIFEIEAYGLAITDYNRANELDPSWSLAWASKCSRGNIFAAIKTLPGDMQMPLLEKCLDPQSWLGKCFAGHKKMLVEIKEMLHALSMKAMTSGGYKAGFFFVDAERHLQTPNNVDYVTPYGL